MIGKLSRPAADLAQLYEDAETAARTRSNRSRFSFSQSEATSIGTRTAICVEGRVVHRHLHRIIWDHVHPGTAATGRPLGPLFGLKGVEATFPLVQTLMRHRQSDPATDEAALQDDLGGLVPHFATHQRSTAAHLDGDALDRVCEPEELERLHSVSHTRLLNTGWTGLPRILSHTLARTTAKI